MVFGANAFRAFTNLLASGTEETVQELIYRPTLHQ